jgi:hypothetical protein
MLKRGNIALMGAVLPGILAYTGWVDAFTTGAKIIALSLLGFSVVSFLLALFEDEDLPAPTSGATVDLAPEPVALVLTEVQLARAAP